MSNIPTGGLGGKKPLRRSTGGHLVTVESVPECSTPPASVLFQFGILAAGVHCVPTRQARTVASGQPWLATLAAHCTAAFHPFR